MLGVDCRETDTSVRISGPIPSSTEESLFDLERESSDRGDCFNKVKQIDKMMIIRQEKRSFLLNNSLLLLLIVFTLSNIIFHSDFKNM